MGVKLRDTGRTNRKSPSKYESPKKKKINNTRNENLFLPEFGSQQVIDISSGSKCPLILIK